jgi:hypothetical protein
MKLTSTVAIIVTVATTQVCASSLLQARDGDAPLVKLYYGMILPLSPTSYRQLAKVRRRGRQRGIQQQLCF